MAKAIARSVEGLQTLITTDNHALLADEPEDVGTALGPDPYELLLAALGSCTVMTLELYAQRKEWPLKGVTAELSHQRIHARDCEDCEQEEGMIDQLAVRLRLEGDLDQAQRERLAYIATRCPVRKTLTGDIKVSDELV